MSREAHIQTKKLRSRLLGSWTNIPSELKHLRCWLLWKIGDRKIDSGKFSKVPIYAATGMQRFGEQGAPGDLANLVHFEQAMRAFRQCESCAGIGIATLPEFGFTALDFDNCVADGVIDSEVLQITNNTYAEISPSGKGIRAFMIGLSNDGKNHTYGLELFSQKGFVTVTGEQICNDYSDLGMPVQQLDAPLRTKLESLAGSNGREAVRRVSRTDPIIEAFKHAELYERDMGRGKHSVGCPFNHEHSDPERAPGDGDTVIHQAHYNGFDRTVIQCSHSHCANRSQREFLDAVGLGDVDDVFEDIDATSNRFHAVPIAEFATEVHMDWTVRNVLPRRGLGVIYGASTAGKTFWTLDIIFAVARGTPDWRHFPVTAGEVVYVAAEGVDGVRKRARAYAKYHDLALIGLPFRVISSTPDLTKGDHSALARAIGRADVIVIDTLAAVMPGADENSAKDVGAVLAHCKHIQETTDALVILVHHSGKNEAAGARGWSGIRAAVDVEICITRSNNDRWAEITKLKDGEGEGKRFPFRLRAVDLGPSQYGDQVSSCVVDQLPGMPESMQKRPTGAIQRTVLDIVTRHGPASIDAILRKAAEKLVYDPEKRDRRRDQARSALTALSGGGYIQLLPNNIVCIPSNSPFDTFEDDSL